MTPGERLKKAREFLGLTQANFGEGIGLPAYKIRDMELDRNKVTAEVALKIQEVYAISYKWLVDEEGEMKLPVSADKMEIYETFTEPEKRMMQLLKENRGMAWEILAVAEERILNARKARKKS